MLHPIRAGAVATLCGVVAAAAVAGGFAAVGNLGAGHSGTVVPADRYVAVTSGTLTRFADCAAVADYMRPLAVDPAVRTATFPYDPWYGPYHSPGADAPTPAVGGAPSHELRIPAQERDPALGQTGVAQARGTLVYTVGRRDGRTVLDVVETAGDRPRVRGSVEFDAFPGPGRLLLLGAGRVLAVSTALTSWPDGGSPRFSGAVTRLTLLDVSRPARPRVLGAQKITGDLVDAFSRDGTARVVLSSGVRVPLDGFDASVPEKQAAERARDAVDAASDGDMLPAFVANDSAGREVASGPLMGCQDVSAPAAPSGLGVLSVLTVDGRRGLAALARPVATGLLSDTHATYAAGDRLWLTTVTGRATFRERGNGLYEPVFSEPSATAIHAFDTSRRGRSPYVGSGAVAGFVLPGAGMSAYGGHLRVLTTDAARVEASGRKGAGSHLYVLAERGSRLVRVGELAGLEKLREIRTASWFGDRAAIVTSRGWRTNENLTRYLDLSDPARPRIVGGARVRPPLVRPEPGPGGDRLLSFRWVGSAREPTTTLTTYDLRRTGVLTRRHTLDLGEDAGSGHLTYLPAHRALVFTGGHVARAPADRCPGPKRARLPRPDLRPGDEFRLRCPFADVDLLFAVAVDPGGRMSLAGRYTDRDGFHALLPVGDRLAAVTANEVVLLDVDGLRPLGAARTAWRGLVSTT